MRKEFMRELVKRAGINKNIWLLTGDLGYGILDEFRDKYPERFIQCGASEQAMLDIAVGLAYEGKLPFVYSITTFLVYRGFETIRTYINHENLPVKLIGSGRDKDYAHDGWSHDATDVRKFLDPFDNLEQFWPIDEKYIPEMLDEMIKNKKPSFISLRR